MTALRLKHSHFSLSDSVCRSNIFSASRVLQAAHSAIKATSEGAVRLGSGILVVHAIASSFPFPPEESRKPSQTLARDCVTSALSAPTSAAPAAGRRVCRGSSPTGSLDSRLRTRSISWAGPGWHHNDTGVNDIHFPWAISLARNTRLHDGLAWPHVTSCFFGRAIMTASTPRIRSRNLVKLITYQVHFIIMHLPLIPKASQNNCYNNGEWIISLLLEIGLLHYSIQPLLFSEMFGIG